MGMALCNSSVELGNGEWVDWKVCAARHCLLSTNGSSAFEKPAIAIPKSTVADASSTSDFVPRAWSPQSGCALRIYNGDEARKCLKERPLLLIGDSTSMGIYHELSLLLDDYRFRPHAPSHSKLLHFHRMENVAVNLNVTVSTIMREAAAIRAHGIVINYGAHLAKAVTRNASCMNTTSSFRLAEYMATVVPPDSRGAYTDWGRGGQNFTRRVSVGRSPTAWRAALEASRVATRGADCDAHLLSAAKGLGGSILGVIERLRAHGFLGRLWWRSIQFNVAFDNTLKLHVNSLLSPTWLWEHWAELGVEHLDIEQMSASRPETFFHQHSNHFFCVCPRDGARGRSTKGADIRQRCHDGPECDHEMRTSVFDNGEPNRYLAQMHLHALCDTPRPHFNHTL